MATRPRGLTRFRALALLIFALIIGMGVASIASGSPATAAQEKEKAAEKKADEKPDEAAEKGIDEKIDDCLLYTSPSPRDQRGSRMPSSA